MLKLNKIRIVIGLKIVRSEFHIIKINGNYTHMIEYFIGYDFPFFIFL